MKKIWRILFLACILFGLTREAFCQTPKIAIENSGAYISDFSVSELQSFYDELEYDKYINPIGNTYPRIFVKNIPADFASIEDKTYANQVFIKILMPLILKINQEILEEREDLIALQEEFQETGDFDDADYAYIEEKAIKYDVTTPFKDTRRYLKLLSELIRKVDVIPPSLLISVAAAHTDWGVSRIVVLGNNLYKARNWYSNDGLESVEDKDEPYRYKVYPSLEAGIREYMLKVNSDINYLQFWNARQESRRRGGYIYGKRLAWTFAAERNMPNYAGLLDYTMTYYKFTYLDEAQLEEEYEFED